MKTILYFLTALMLLVHTSCSLNAKFKNRKADREDAEAVLTPFFNKVRNGDFRATLPYFSDKFFAVTSQANLWSIFKTVDQQMGSLQDTEIETWQTNVSKGTNPSGTYLFKYMCRYEKGRAINDVNLMLERDGKIRIVYYFVTMDSGSLPKSGSTEISESDSIPIVEHGMP